MLGLLSSGWATWILWHPNCSIRESTVNFLLTGGILPLAYLTAQKAGISEGWKYYLNRYWTNLYQNAPLCNITEWWWWVVLLQGAMLSGWEVSLRTIVKWGLRIMWVTWLSQLQQLWHQIHKGVFSREFFYVKSIRVKNSVKVSTIIWWWYKIPHHQFDLFRKKTICRKSSKFVISYDAKLHEFIKTSYFLAQNIDNKVHSSLV